jgi:hypothetical protein
MARCAGALLSVLAGRSGEAGDVGDAGEAKSWMWVPLGDLAMLLRMRRWLAGVVGWRWRGKSEWARVCAEENSAGRSPGAHGSSAAP